MDWCCSKYMSNNISKFLDFVEWEGAVQVSKNEATRSKRGETVRMLTMMDGVQHYVTLRDVMYTPGILNNLISIAQDSKDRFKMRIDEDSSKETRRRMDLHHKTSDKVVTCGFETREGLLEAVTHMCSNAALVTRTDFGA